MDSAGYTPIMAAAKSEGSAAKVIENMLKDLKIDHSAPVPKPQAKPAAGAAVQPKVSYSYSPSITPSLF